MLPFLPFSRPCLLYSFTSSTILVRLSALPFCHFALIRWLIRRLTRMFLDWSILPPYHFTAPSGFSIFAILGRLSALPFYHLYHFRDPVIFAFAVAPIAFLAFSRSILPEA